MLTIFTLVESKKFATQWHAHHTYSRGNVKIKSTSVKVFSKKRENYQTFRLLICPSFFRLYNSSFELLFWC